MHNAQLSKKVMMVGRDLSIFDAITAAQTSEEEKR